jgi:hypothetical protein
MMRTTKEVNTDIAHAHIHQDFLAKENFCNTYGIGECLYYITWHGAPWFPTVELWCH